MFVKRTQLISDVIWAWLDVNRTCPCLVSQKDPNLPTIEDVHIRNDKKNAVKYLVMPEKW